MNNDAVTPEQRRAAALALLALVEAEVRGDDEAKAILAPETLAEAAAQFEFAAMLLGDLIRNGTVVDAERRRMIRDWIEHGAIGGSA